MDVCDDVAVEVIDDVALLVTELVPVDVCDDVADDVADDVIEEVADVVTLDVCDDVTDDVADVVTLEVAEDVKDEVAVEDTDDVAVEVCVVIPQSINSWFLCRAMISFRMSTPASHLDSSSNSKRKTGKWVSTPFLHMSAFAAGECHDSFCSISKMICVNDSAILAHSASPVPTKVDVSKATVAKSLLFDALHPSAAFTAALPGFVRKTKPATSELVSTQSFASFPTKFFILYPPEFAVMST